MSKHSIPYLLENVNVTKTVLSLNCKEKVFSRAYELKDIQKVADLPDGASDGFPSLSDDKSATDYSVSDLFALVKQIV